MEPRKRKHHCHREQERYSGGNDIVEENAMLRSENEKYMKFCMSLLSMLQVAGVDPYAALSNSPLPHIEVEFSRKRNQAPTVGDLPIDCTAMTFGYLHTPEVCNLKAVSSLFEKAANRSLKRPRSVLYRQGVDVDELEWLRNVGASVKTINSVEIEERDHVLNRACENEEIEAICVLMKDPRFSVKYWNFGYLTKTPFLLAASRGDVELMRKLCKYLDADTFEIGQDLLEDGLEINGANPLHVACFFGKVEIVRMLLSHGACDVEQDAGLWPPSHDLESAIEVRALHLAVYDNRLGVVQTLLADVRIDPNVRQSDGKTAFFLAVEYGHVDMARELLADERVDPNVRRYGDGKTALFVALKRRDVEMVRALLDCARVDVNARDASGSSVLDEIASSLVHGVRSGDVSDASAEIVSACRCLELLLGCGRWNAQSVSEAHGNEPGLS